MRTILFSIAMLMATTLVAEEPQNTKKAVEYEAISFEEVQLDIRGERLTVAGKTGVPRTVHLIPYAYAAQSNYWGYRIVAVKNNNTVIQVVTPYRKTIRMNGMNGMKGRRGIEIIGVGRSLKIAF